MDIASEDTFYIVGNELDEINLTNVGIIKRGESQRVSNEDN